MVVNEILAETLNCKKSRYFFKNLVTKSAVVRKLCLKVWSLSNRDW